MLKVSCLLSRFVYSIILLFLSSFQTLLLRLVLSSREARRIQLSAVPESVDQLIGVLKERLDLQGDFTVQFEDPDFGNALCNLTAMSELPTELCCAAHNVEL